jgi:archaellum biogenesis ATPase FlaH
MNKLKEYKDLKQEILNRIDFKDFYYSELQSFKITNSKYAMALCPFHDDTRASLKVDLETGIYHCFGCEEKGDIFSFYQKKHDIANFKTVLQELAEYVGLEYVRKTTEVNKETNKIIDAIYNYTDEQNILVFQILRYKPKDFRVRRPDHSQDEPDKWIYNLDDTQLVPYNLPDVIKSLDVILVEGEGKVEILKEMSLTASCNPFGAGKWRHEYNKYFKDKNVYIISDNDEVGRNHALEVAKSLKNTAKLIKIIELPGLPEKGDIKEWVEQGGTKEKLLKIIEETPEWKDEQKDDQLKERIEKQIEKLIEEQAKEQIEKQIEEKIGTNLLSYLIRWNEMLNLDIKIEYLLDKLIPKGSIILLFGRGGIGKTSLCLQIARAIAEGLPFGNLQTLKTPVYYIDFENPLSVLKQRLEYIGNTENVYIWHISNKLKPPRLDTKEWELYKQLTAGLLIFDTYRASHQLDENKSQDMAIIMAKLKELRELGFTIIFLHHTPKGNESIYKGSTAILDLVDHVLSIESVKEEGEPIEFDRDNLYRFGARIKTRYEPYHIFLKFNPDVKSFDVAKDPDIEKIQDIQIILQDSKKIPNQTEFRKIIRNELGLTDHEARRLIKKGEGICWQKIKQGEGKGHKAFCYVVMPDISLINQYNKRWFPSLENITK